MAGRVGIPDLVRSLFHFIIFSIYIVALNWDANHVTPRVGRTFAGRWKYLTFINELLQTFYFAVATLNDVFGSTSYPKDNPKLRSGLQKFRDNVLTGLAFPMGTFVVVTFWGIYAIDRELVYPKALDAIFPSWLNHVMHTTVVVFLLIEKFFIYHPYPSRRQGLTMCLTFASLYQVWIFWIAYYADFWVYPILAVLPWPGRLGFLAVCWSLVFIFYVCGEFITNKLWSVPAKSRAKKAQ